MSTNDGVLKESDGLILKEEKVIKLNVDIEAGRAHMDLGQYIILLEHLQFLQDDLVKTQNELLYLRKNGKEQPKTLKGKAFMWGLHIP